VTVENAGASTTQTIKVNGVTIELKVNGPGGTSTITQSAQKVSVACKQFEVIAEETISLKSTLGSTWKSDLSIDLEGTQKISASTPGSLALDGKTMATLSSAQVTVKADAVLQLESSAMAALKGALTSVQGNLVTIG
jgi:phage baseplate assembly protein gpV